MFNMTVPEDQKAHVRFVNGINATGGGDEPENSLEAIFQAVKSDWTREGGCFRRHIILLFTDTSALPLHDPSRVKARDYPVDTPNSLPWALVRRRDSEDSQERLVLCQLMQAQEDSVGAITNFIGPNNDFYLRCDYFRLEKPCAIMAASDGAFDFFPTTIHFEQFLMYKLMQSNDPEDCAERLKQYYFDVNTNDDSSTIAFMAFGFDDYAQIQRLANRRQIELAEKYALDDETLYSQETGPNYALDCARSGKQGQLVQFRDALWEESPSLREAALSVAEENNGTRMKQIEAKCDEALARQRRAHKDALQAFSAAVRKSWLTIRVSKGLRDKIKVPLLMGLLSEQISIQDEYRRRDDHRKALVKLSGEMRKGLSEWCDAAKAMENPLASADRRILERANDYYGMYTDHICDWPCSVFSVNAEKPRQQMIP